MITRRPCVEEALPGGLVHAAAPALLEFALRSRGVQRGTDLVRLRRRKDNRDNRDSMLQEGVNLPEAGGCRKVLLDEERRFGVHGVHGFFFGRHPTELKTTKLTSDR